jgi:hypothetical protein
MDGRLGVLERWVSYVSTLPERFPLEVFHRVRHITEIPADLRRFERAIQQSASRTDKWQTSSIFNVTGLFTNQKEAGMSNPRPENRLASSLPKGTAPAVLGSHLCLF